MKLAMRLESRKTHQLHVDATPRHVQLVSSSPDLVKHLVGVIDFLLSSLDESVGFGDGVLVDWTQVSEGRGS